MADRRHRGPPNPGRGLGLWLDRLSEIERKAEDARFREALRASFNSALADLGCPLEWRRELMGHSQRGVTERHYTKYREEIAREWLGKLWTAFEAVRADRAST